MKNITAFIISAVFALPMVASAATFVVTPLSGSYQEGSTVTLNVSVNPAGSTVYTAMLDARFSPSTFEVVSFTLNDALLPLKQGGYDALNNTNGVLTKTGGYTGGITSTTPFGTIVLRAKSAGAGTFTVADTSKLLDGNNADQQTGTQTNSYTITAKPVTSPSTPAPTAAKNTTKKAEPNASATTVEKSPATTSNAAEAPAQVAAVSQTDTGMSTTMLWILWALSVVVSFVVGLFVGRRML